MCWSNQDGTRLSLSQFVCAVVVAIVTNKACILVSLHSFTLVKGNASFKFFMTITVENAKIITSRVLVRYCVTVSRLLFDACNGSLSGLMSDVLKLLTVLCSSERVQMIGLLCIFVFSLNAGLIAFFVLCYLNFLEFPYLFVLLYCVQCFV